jgi:hypothetical protein
MAGDEGYCRRADLDKSLDISPQTGYLQPMKIAKVFPIDRIPVRPAGYFAKCYTKKEIQEQNRLAKASVIRAPADLE